MNIIVDTHIFLWLLIEPEKISQKYLEYIDIVERLKPLDPVKIILFGSYAYGKTGEASG